MTCTIPEQEITGAIAFHGHSCPGLAIGIRVAEYVRNTFPASAAADVLCVTETDMCGVDAIQFLTGCTFGKGNLIHRDYGKAAFSFYDRAAGRAFRLTLQPGARGKEHREMAELMGRNQKGELPPDENTRMARLRSLVQERLMSLPLEELFTCSQLEYRPPRAARVLQSLICEACGEETMESRTRRFAGQTLCIPCYEQVEQKV